MPDTPLYQKSFLEERQEVETIAERDAIETHPAGMRVYVKSEDQSYIWTGSEWVGYTRLNGDGQCPVPEVGTGENEGKVLTAGARPGEVEWKPIPKNIYDVFTGPTPEAEAADGLVPAPTENDGGKFLKSDGTWSEVPSNEYDVFDAENDGLVPKSEDADETKFLAANGKWVSPFGGEPTDPDEPATENKFEMTGATDEEDGKSGLVPAPTTTDRTKFLRGDGTWASPEDLDTTYNVFDETQNGLVPKPEAADKTKFLAADGTWVCPFGSEPTDPDDPESGEENNIYNMVGTDGETDGKAGLVPAPTVDDVDKFLKSDGTWAAVNTSNVGSEPLVANVKNKAIINFATIEYNGSANEIATYDTPYCLVLLRCMADNNMRPSDIYVKLELGGGDGDMNSIIRAVNPNINNTELGVDVVKTSDNEINMYLTNSDSNVLYIMDYSIIFKDNDTLKAFDIVLKQGAVDGIGEVGGEPIQKKKLKSNS